MRKFYLLLAATLLALPSMFAQYTFHLNFEGGASAYKNVTIQDYDMEPITVTGNSFDCTVTGQPMFLIYPANGAQITEISTEYGTCSASEPSFMYPSGSQPSIYIMYQSSGQGYSYMVASYNPTALADIPITVKVEGGVEEATPIYLATGRVLNEPIENGVFQPGDSDDVWTGTFTIQPKANFRFVRENGTSSGEGAGDEDNGGQKVYSNVGPTTDNTDVTFTNSNTSFTGNVAVGGSGWWKLNNDVECTIKMTVDLNSGTVEFVNQTTLPSHVTLNFTGVADAYQYVSGMDMAAQEPDMIKFESDTYDFTFTSTGGLMLSTQEGYEMSISCTDLEAGEGTYQVTGIGGASTSEQSAQFMLALFEGANGHTFDINVVKLPYKATIIFTGVENAYQYVTGINMASQDMDPVIFDSASYTYEYNDMGALMLAAKDGYELTISCFTLEPGSDTYNVQSFDGITTSEQAAQLMLGLYGGANGHTFTVNVIQLPYEVNLEFTGIENAYQFVTAMDMNNEGDIITLDGESTTFSYMNQAGIMFAAQEGYEMTISCEGLTPGEETYMVSSVSQMDESEPGAQLMLMLFAGANTHTFIVNVKKLPVESTVSMTFIGEDLEKEASDYVNVEAKVGENPIDLNIIDDECEFTILENATLSFTPAEGYELNITSTSELEENDIVIINEDENGIVVNVTYSEAFPEVLLTITVNPIKKDDDNNGDDDNTGDDNTGDIEDGIAGIQADANGSYTIYTVEGIKVMNTKDANDLRNLSNGLYIINGKKVIIRK